MNKFLLTFALVLSSASLLLAKLAVDDMPKRVDAGGHLLRVRTEGTGSPTVILEIGLTGALEEWAAVQSEVAKFTRVVAYDRTGAYHTEPVLTGRQIALELHAALANAHVPPPYVLVGQSFGGVYNEIFAQMYPNEVVGMVLLDPTTEKFIHWMAANHPSKEFSRERHEQWPEAAGVLPTLDELNTNGPLPNVPVVVVTAARVDPKAWFAIDALPVWTSAHDEFAKQLPQGRHIIDKNSGHGIQVEDPQLVIDLIREIVDQTRQQQLSKSNTIDEREASQ